MGPAAANPAIPPDEAWLGSPIGPSVPAPVWKALQERGRQAGRQGCPRPGMMPPPGRRAPPARGGTDRPEVGLAWPEEAMAAGSRTRAGRGGRVALRNHRRPALARPFLACWDLPPSEGASRRRRPPSTPRESVPAPRQPAAKSCGRAAVQRPG